MPDEISGEYVNILITPVDIGDRYPINENEFRQLIFPDVEKLTGEEGSPRTRKEAAKRILSLYQLMVAAKSASDGQINYLIDSFGVLKRYIQEALGSSSLGMADVVFVTEKDYGEIQKNVYKVTEGADYRSSGRRGDWRGRFGELNINGIRENSI